MENLDSLTNLTWLDLSFNNIAVIEGVQIVGAQNLKAGACTASAPFATGCCVHGCWQGALENKGCNTWGDKC